MPVAQAGLDDAQVYLPDLWATHAKYFPEKEAVVCGAERVTWADFDRGLNRVANRLLEMGLGAGNAVAVVMSNSADMMSALFGVVKAGACVVPISGLLTAEQVLMMLRDSDAAAVIVSASLRHLVEPVRDRTDIPGEAFIAHGFEGEGWTGWDAWLADAPETAPDVRYAMDQPFNIIYSSGTTGVPKGIVQTHRARQHWSWSNAIEMRFTGESRALTTTSLYSNGTWLMVLPVLFTGGSLHVLPEFTPDAFLETVQRERITHTFMVPTQYIVTLAHQGFDGFDLSSLEVMLSAGSPLRLETKREILNRMGPGLHELYGFSEGFATMLKPAQMLEKFDSVGTPVLGFDLAILDGDGRELPRGEVGEIAGYGAGLMAEYNNRPELVAEAIWHDDRGRTYFRSGDVGRLDGDGYLYIVDRKKDMIISGGFNIFPADLEEVIGEHPDVQDVTVIGVPHAKWGETPLALVIPANGEADAEAIRTWANDRLAKSQRISEVAFRDEFPRNALGKVLKRELREEISG